MLKRKHAVLLCTNAYPPNFIGGAELIAHYQGKALQALGHSVAVFAGSAEPVGRRHGMREDMFDGIRVARIRLDPSDCEPNFVNFHHPPIEERFSEVLDRFRPSVIHFHNIIGLGLGIVGAAHRRGIATVMTLHDHWGFCFRNTLIRPGGAVCHDYSECASCMPYISDGAARDIPIELRNDYARLQLRQVDRFISPSAYLAAAYAEAGFDRARTRVIWNGVDVRRFSQHAKVPPNGRIRFAFLGHLGQHKGLSLIPDAIAMLPDKTNVQVRIYGDGPMRGYLEQSVRALGLHDSLQLCGKLENSCVHEVLAQTDVLLLPSVWPENQPVSITEAMAASIPVIASRIGGIPELVVDGVTGRLVEPGNANDLSSAMRSCIENSGAREKWGAAAFERIRNHTFETQVKEIVKVYDELS